MKPAKKLLYDLEIIYSLIGRECGHSVSYNLSLNGTLFPAVAILLLEEEEKDFRLIPLPQGGIYSVDKFEEDKKEIESDCRFLAENNFIFPKDLANGTLTDFSAYATTHADEILSKIRSEAESDYESVFGEKYAID